LLEPTSEQGSDVRTGFARVHSNEHTRSALLALEVLAERAPGSAKSAIVKGWSAGDTANSIGSEEFFGHR
jgi:hypothetical protein